MAELIVNDNILGLRDLENVPEIDLKKNISTQGYNPLKVPADVEMAKKHGQAKKVYISKEEDGLDEQGREVCPCCLLPVEGKPIPLCASIQRLYHLGSGFALYFRFIRFTIGGLLLVLLISGIFNLVTNNKSMDCSEDANNPNAYCIQGYILSYAIPNKRDERDYLTAQAALNLAVVIVIMLAFHVLRYQFRKTEVEADDRTITPSDYTIVIEEIPPETTNHEIVEWIQTLAPPEKTLQIEKITRAYHINNYIHLTHERTRLLAFQAACETKKKGRKLSAEEEQKLQKVNERLKSVNMMLDEMRSGEREIKRCPVAYVTFKYAVDANYVTGKFKKPLLAKMFGIFMSKFITTFDQIKGVRVVVERAPEPSDILWLNLGYTSKQRDAKKLFTTFITWVLIFLSFGVIILVNWAQNEASKKFGKGSPTVQGLSIVASVVIVVTNTVLTITIDFLAKYEKNMTNTYYLRGVAQKLAVAQFVNTALTSLFAELILVDDPGSNRVQAMNFYGKGGLIEGIFWVFVTNALLGPVMTIFDPTYFMKRFSQWLFIRKGANNKLTQKEANTLFEGTSLNMPAKFAAMIKIALMTTFYAPALPFALLITSVGLALSYWADKYVLLRRNVLPTSLDDDLTDTMVEYLEWTACTFAVGNVIYTFTLQNSVGDGTLAFGPEAWVMAWVGFGLSMFHVIFPMEALNAKLFPIKDEVTETKTYEEARPDFNTDYDIENPITRSKALEKFLRKLKRAESPDAVKSITKGFGLEAEALSMIDLKLQEPVIDFRSLDRYANRVGAEEQATKAGGSRKGSLIELPKLVPSSNPGEKEHLDSKDEETALKQVNQEEQLPIEIPDNQEEQRVEQGQEREQYQDHENSQYQDHDQVEDPNKQTWSPPNEQQENPELLSADLSPNVRYEEHDGLGTPKRDVITRSLFQK